MLLLGSSGACVQGLGSVPTVTVGDGFAVSFCPPPLLFPRSARARGTRGESPPGRPAPRLRVLGVLGALRDGAGG